MTLTTPAFYVPQDDGFQATTHTRGPWSNEHQHGGPPSALVVRGLEAAAREHFGDDPHFPARVTVEFLRPVPIGLLRVETRSIRIGGKVIRLEGSLFSGDDEVVRVWSLFVREGELDAPAEVFAHGPALPPPVTGTSQPFPFFLHDHGYHTATDVRILGGNYGKGNLTAWMTQRVPLVLGEEPSPLQRLMVVCDSGNGLSFGLDSTVYSFVNPDLTLHLWRLPRTHWIGMQAKTEITDRSVGLAHVRLSDENGPLGISLQSLLFAKNRG